MHGMCLVGFNLCGDSKVDRIIAVFVSKVQDSNQCFTRSP